MSDSRYSLFAALSNQMKFLVSLFIAYNLTPFIIQSIGKEGYGIWVLVLSTIALFELLDLGLTGASAKYVAEQEVLRDTEKRNSILSTIFCSHVMLAALGVISISIFSLFFNEIFSIPVPFQNIALLLIALFSLRYLVFSLPFAVYKGILQGLKRTMAMNLSIVAAQVLYAIAVWQALRNGWGIAAMGFIFCAQGILENALIVVFSYFYLDDLKISFKAVNFKLLRDIASFSLMIAIAGTSTMIVMRADPIIIQLFLSLGFVALFAIPSNLTVFAIYLLKGFTSTLFPIIARLFSTGEIEKLKWVILDFTKYAVGFGTLVLINGMFFGGNLILLWVGEQFMESIPIFQILLIGVWISVPLLTIAPVLGIGGHHFFVSKMFLAEIVTNIGASIALVQFYGLKGVAAGTVISNVVAFTIAFTKFKEMFRIKTYRFLSYCIFPSFIPGLIAVLAALGARQYGQPENLFSMAMLLFPSTLTYCAGFWFFSLTEREKMRFLAILKR